MNNDFLREYIHLEKLCNDMFGVNHGVSRYIEEMENSDSYAVRSRIPSWTVTYKKLKEIRWKRNMFVHEGDVNFDNADVKWIMNFHQLIINGKDPLTIGRKSKAGLEMKAVNNWYVDRPNHRTNSERFDLNGRGLFVAIAFIIGFLYCLYYLSR